MHLCAERLDKKYTHSAKSAKLAFSYIYKERKTNEQVEYTLILFNVLSEILNDTRNDAKDSTSGCKTDTAADGRHLSPPVAKWARKLSPTAHDARADGAWLDTGR